MQSRVIQSIERQKMKYQPIESKKPLAKFWYKGSHSHPIKRTVLIIDENKDRIIGYELREGNIVRKLGVAPVKTFKKEKIAKYSDLGAANHRKPGGRRSTLRKSPLLEVLDKGL